MTVADYTTQVLAILRDLEPALTVAVAAILAMRLTGWVIYQFRSVARG